MQWKAINKPFLIFTLTITVFYACKSDQIAKKSSYFERVQKDSIFEDRTFRFPSSSLNIETEFLFPTPSQPIAGKFEKFEIGLVLPEQISAMVDEFLNNPNIKYANPYDEEHINIEAFFSNEKDTLRSYGFYYMDYNRDLRKNNAWLNNFTDYNWRIRFAPPDTGKWNCDIKISFPNSDIQPIYKNNIEFNCVENPRDGFITDDDDHRHLKFADTDSTFFVIGQNLDWTDAPIFNGKWLNGDNKEFNFKNKDFHQRLFQVGYLDFNSYIENVAKNHGNMVRLINWPDAYLFEWEERGVYGSNRNQNDQNFMRQKRAWELDHLFNSAETNNVKLLFCMEFPGNFNYSWNGGKEYSFNQSPYNKVVTGDNVDMKLPQEFFDDPTLIHDYKKKIRYFMARWGYSPSLGVYQLINEFDSFGIDSTNAKKELHTILKTNVRVQKDIKEWHEELGTYIHSLVDRPILVTSGFKSNTLPTYAPPSRNFFSANGIDIVIHNIYGNDRSQNYVMYAIAQKSLKFFDKPFLYAETGILTDALTNVDPNDLEGCSDVMFHNFAWAGAVMGNAGTSLNWWQPFDNKRRENFIGLYSFFSKIDFQSKDFVEQNFWTDKGIMVYRCGNLQKLINKKSMIEVYSVRTTKKDESKTQESFGWAHNLSNFWANLDVYINCKDRNNQTVKIRGCSNDENTEPLVLDTNTYQIKIKGLKSKRSYSIKWYSTRGNSELVKTVIGETNGVGMIKFFWPGSDFDYAFKLDELPFDQQKQKK